ncbi:MAG TPA: MoxR family ATPase, partial [Leifsonia sp.]|nr:MoxR family ATPase [Leifsonia sp.]
AAAELAMLRQRESSSPLDRLQSVVTTQQLLAMIRTVRAVFVSRSVERYAVAITQATRHDHDLRLGASPRATLQLVRAAKARAALDGREFVLPDDIDALAVSVLAHRLIPSSRLSGGADGVHSGSLADVVLRILAATPVPLGSAGSV